MLRWVILSVVVVALAAAATVLVQFAPEPGSTTKWPATPKVTGPQPKVEVEGDLTHDFGAMSQRQSGHKNFKVKNVGQGDLEVWMEHSTCSCTIANLKEGKRAFLKPGESTDIDLAWETRTFTDEFKREVVIGTNDPERPTFNLKVHGFIHPPIIRIPPDDAITIGSIPVDDTKKLTVGLFAPDRKETKVTKVSSSRPDLVVVKPVSLTREDLKQMTPRKGIKLESGYRLDIEVKPGMPLGTLREEISIQTDHPQQPRIDLTLVGFVTGPISVIPSNLRMINVNGKQGGSGELKVLVRGNKATQFTLAHKPEKLDVSIVPSDDPGDKGRYRLLVKVPPGTAAGLVDDEIIFKTDHPKVSELKIPVSVLVSG